MQPRCLSLVRGWAIPEWDHGRQLKSRMILELAVPLARCKQLLKSEPEVFLQFDVYDDLSMSYTDADRRDPAKARPTLGGSQEWPYPRRLRTGGAKRQHAGGEPVVCSASGAGFCCAGTVCCLVVPALCSCLDRPAVSPACQYLGEVSELHKS